MTHEANRKRWRGILAGEQAVVRHAVAIVLFVLAVAVPFGPLGYWPIANAHALASIIPVTLASLLFGKWVGCAVGAAAGVAEMVHALFQPYDYYEKYFSMPFNSIVLLALFGFGLGALFACACRLPRNIDSPATGTPTLSAARIIAIVASTAACSLLFALLLHGGILLANTAFAHYIPEGIAARSSNAEGIIGQACLHAALCALPCAITDWAVGRFGQAKHKLRIRTTFQIWLGALTVGFFFVASAAAYTSLTYLSITNMNVALSDQIESLAADLRQRDGIVNTLSERGVLQRDELEAFASQQYRRIDCDLAGWFQDTTVLAENGRIFASNNEAAVGSTLADIVAPGTGDAVVSRAIEANKAVECYQGPGFEISYLRAIEVGYERLGKAGTYQLATIVPAKETFLNRPLYMYIVAAVFAALLGTIIILLMGLLRRTVTRPVDAANETLERITAGELDQRVPDARSAEFSSLAEGINTTVSALEDSISEANARIDRELAAARAIQEGALPTARPPFPDIDAFDLYAKMNPAREVGGDFYDYFDLGARGIGFVVADVSGKGMPAALFMMAAKTAIRGAMEAKANLAEAMRIANRSLCEGNDSEMFVTAFAGIFDYRSGKLTYVNAGHNKPLILHDGEWRWLKERSGPYLGSFDWIEYKQFQLQLEQGDELFAYTDGVNEAFNAHEELYGNERLEAFLSSHAELHPRRLLRALRADLIGWAIGTEQSDDITMLALKYGIPPEHGASLITTADLANFEQIERFVTRLLDEADCPPKASRHVLMVVEELVVNVCNYAYPDVAADKPRPLRIHFTHRTDPHAIVIEVGDDGVSFNPLAHEDPERPGSIEEAKIGGLGLVMTKKLMDEVEYVREGIANVTIITKRWS